MVTKRIHGTSSPHNAMHFTYNETGVMDFTSCKYVPVIAEELGTLHASS